MKYVFAVLFTVVVVLCIIATVADFTNLYGALLK